MSLSQVLKKTDEFTFAGKIWTVSAPDCLEVIEKMERWIPRFARECIEKTRPDTRPSEEVDPVGWGFYASDLADHRTKLNSGFFRYGGVGYSAIIDDTAAGAKALIFECVYANHPKDWSRDLTEQLHSDREKWFEMLELLRRFSDPNRKARPSQAG